MAIEQGLITEGHLIRVGTQDEMDLKAINMLNGDGVPIQAMVERLYGLTEIAQTVARPIELSLQREQVVDEQKHDFGIHDGIFLISQQGIKYERYVIQRLTSAPSGPSRMARRSTKLSVSEDGGLVLNYERQKALRNNCTSVEEAGEVHISASGIVTGTLRGIYINGNTPYELLSAFLRETELLYKT